MAAIKVAIDHGVVVVSVEGPELVQETTIQQVYKEVMAVIEEENERWFVLNLERAATMSSSALGMLIRIQKECRKRMARLKLCGLSTAGQEVFEATGLAKVFEIHATAADAVKAFTLFQSAYSIVRSYYRKVLRDLAEEILDKESEFAEPHLFNADNFLDTHAHGLWSMKTVIDCLKCAADEENPYYTRIEVREVDCGSADQIQVEVNAWLASHPGIHPLSLVVVDAGDSRWKCLVLCEAPVKVK